MNFYLPEKRSELISRLTGRVPHGVMGDMSGNDNEIDVKTARELWNNIEMVSERRTIYLHIPFCVKRCKFCGFYKNRTTTHDLSQYTDYLLRELEMVADKPVASGTFNTVYFGGGTPTDLSAGDLERLIRAIHDKIKLADDVEFTVEGRLFGFDDDKVRACLDAGATRFSFGVQTFHTERRQALGRIQSRKKLLERLERIKRIGGDRACTVIDLIYGLPGQSLEEWLDDIRTAHEETLLDGIDLYLLKMLPGAPLTTTFGDVPWSDEELMERQAKAGEYLLAQDWRRLSITHWSRGTLERNRYNHQTKTGGEMLPLGCGAGGSAGGYSFMQMMPLDEYKAQIDAGHKPIGMVRKVQPRPLNSKVTDQMERGFFNPTDFAIRCERLADNWRDAGVWTRVEEGALRLTKIGQFYQPRLNNMLAAYLSKGGDDGPFGAAKEQGK
ncbi:radical SAM protein [uncultured Desulfuromonas sp.]|uniref:radical SAM protein n=1 Tax=uncultured Desulfuromonas sp. TaxID=181013 RepID=UPI002AABFCA4|nr:radical SAM protein [uncultured Desulfuromonas sp.]